MAKSKFQKLCNNLYFLYFVYALVLINVLTFVYLKKWNSLLLFLILLLVFQCVTKNMCLLLLASLLITNLFFSHTVLFEGFEAKKNLKNSAKVNEKKTPHPKMKNDNQKINKEQTKKLNDHLEKAKTQHKKITKNINASPDKVKHLKKMAEHPKVQKQIKQVKKTQNKKDIKDFNNQVDYSKTYNDSMKHLNDILSNKGIEGLTNETKELINSQKALTANIQNLEPWLQNAGGMLKKLDLGGITSTLSSFDGLFGGKKK